MGESGGRGGRGACKRGQCVGRLLWAGGFSIKVKGGGVRGEVWVGGWGG